MTAITRTWRFVIEGGEIPVLWLNDTPIELTWEQAEKVERTIVALRENGSSDDHTNTEEK